MKRYDIEMNPCSDMDFVMKSEIEPIDRVTEAHLKVPQFFCPNAFDMSFFGNVNDSYKKILWVDVESTTENSDDYIEGKHIGMLVNTKEIEFTDNYE